MNNRISRNGSVHLILVIIGIVIVLGALGFLFWKNFMAPKDTIQNQTISSFDECKKASGSVIRETYPEQCVTSGGDTFVGPSNAQSDVALKTYCSSGEKLCFDYLPTWKIDTYDISDENTGFNGDRLTVSGSSSTIKLHLQSGIDGIGGTCEPDGTTIYVLDSLPVPKMTGLKTDFEYSRDDARVAKVITVDSQGKFTPHFYVTSSSKFSTKGDITDIGGLCFSQLLSGKNVTLSNEYEGSGSFLFGTAGLFGGNTDEVDMTYDTLTAAKQVFDTTAYIEAAAVMSSLRYQ